MSYMEREDTESYKLVKKKAVPVAYSLFFAQKHYIYSILCHNIIYIYKY